MLKKSLLLAICTLLLPQLAQPLSAFQLKKGDTVAMVGNGLADRMQHDGWLETVLQSSLPGHELRFRNLAFSGDRVDKFPRNKGSFSQEWFIDHIKPNVIFFFFGYNESYENQPGKYKDKLVGLVNKFQSRKGLKTKPRIVLFSPIAFEDLGNPNLPNGFKQNQNLLAYTKATEDAAKAVNATFVDLYTPTLKLFNLDTKDYTINGVHLNEDGNRKLGEIIASVLLNKDITATPKMEKVRDAVLDKNWHWHNRFRATDGNDVWGGRSKLSFMNGQTNRVVLMHELTMLDVMTANRDPAIWAAVSGKQYNVDDSNVPKPLKVITNVGTGKHKSNKGKEGGKYISAKESVKKTKVPDGFELNVFASEEMFPDLANPVQMQVDAKGRVWAASWNTYPKWEPLKEMKDSLMIFPDEDRDGVADKAIVFARVHCPLGFEFWNGGVLVTSGPDLLFLKDTDGDDVADVRYVILQGLGTSDTHHAANNLVFGPDGGIYWQSGVFLVHNHEHPWGSSLQTGKSALYRFDPRRHTINLIVGNGPNPHGIAFDRYGYCYINDGTSGKAFQVFPEKNGFNKRGLLRKQVRPVPANGIVSSTHFPDDMQGNFLICNAIGYLGLKQYKLNRSNNGKHGEVWGDPTTEILKSDDRNFRPTDVVFGDDGAMYVSDWCNVIIGHMQHNIRDPMRDKKHGRIMRMTASGRPLQAPTKIHGQPIDKLLENLKHPANGVRHRTRVELSGRKTADVIAALDKWTSSLNVSDDKQAHQLLEALFVHAQHNVRNEKLLATVKKSKNPHIVNGAKWIGHFWNKVDTTSGRVIDLSKEEKRKKVKAPSHLRGEDAKLYVKGGEVFAREAHCMTCHQEHGEGLQNVYPPLAKSQWVTGDEERLIKLTLKGLWGKIEVNGKTYDPAKGVPPMTAFAAILNDEEVAAVLTYVRNTWGNKAPAVKPSTVARVRSQTKGQTMFYKPEDLLKQHPMKK